MFLSILKQFVILREEYKQYIKKILKILKKVELQINIKKYDFYIIKIKFLDLLINMHKMRLNLARIKIIQK